MKLRFTRKETQEGYLLLISPEYEIKKEIYIELPPQACYQASGTNEGGIVVCWCEKLPWQWTDAYM